MKFPILTRRSDRGYLVLFAALTPLVVAIFAFTGALASSAAGDPFIVAAGDIACDPTLSTFNGGNGTATSCHMKATASLVLSLNPAAALALGDTQYASATLAEYSQSYNPTWGQFKALTRPIVGNHEYLTANAADYFTYFGAIGGDPTKGYYSYNIGAWHLIALNSECVNVGSCKPGSPQETWLKADLAANPGKCTLAYWHEPMFSSGHSGNNPQTITFWQDLMAAHADIVLSAHDHDYERFAPQNATGAADPTNGLREFVVGTGGADHNGGMWGTIKPNSEVRDINTYGLLQLTLHTTSYDWKFVPEPGGTFTDSGSQSCKIAGSGPAPTPTNGPAPTATPGGSIKNKNYLLLLPLLTR